MTNVTITVDEDVARWARIEAAKRDTSLSRLVGELLKQKMLTEEGYRSAEKQFFGVAPRPLREESTSLPNREEFHDRARLR